MIPVKVAEKKVWVGETAVPLLSGEVHYWRIDPANWRPALRRVKEMGVKTAASYVCWDFHEVKPGQFDFTGTTDPRRNLKGFLDLLAEEDLWVIFRPGPYIYAEWRNNGVPDRAARLHRLDPAYLQMAREYMQAVTECALPYQATNGGKIILWQADNEIDPWPQNYTEQLGLGSTPGPFQEFLREEYGSLDALNQAWENNYMDFGQAQAVGSMHPDQPAMMRRYLDYARFQHWYVKKAAAWAVNTYKELGVQVPVYLNAYSGVGTQPWADMEEIADITGPDIYPSRELALRSGESRTLLEAVRYTRTYSRLPYIPEFESGIWHDWLPDVGVLPANHYRLICISALLAGAAGWNWYMLVNRDNWYQCPINEWGRTRPDLFQAFSDIVNLFEQLDPPTLTKLTRTAVTFDPLQRATQRPGQDLLNAVYSAGIDYEFFDLNRGERCDQPVMFYAGGGWLSQAGQQRLIDYVESGGTLFLCGVYPRLDDRLRPLNLLGIRPPDGSLGGSLVARPEFGGCGALKLPWMHTFTETPGTPIYAERLPTPHTQEENLLQNSLQAGNRYIVGYSEPRGKGKLVYLGLPPSPALILAAHRQAGIGIPARALTPGVSTALFRRGREYYLGAVNAGGEDKAVEIELNLEIEAPPVWEVTRLDVPGSQPYKQSANANRLTFSLGRKDGVFVRLRETQV